MFKSLHIGDVLQQEKRKHFGEEERLVAEARRMLIAEQFTEKNILDHLGSYIRSFEFLDEENLDERILFRKEEIRKCCIAYRLKFLDSQAFNGEFPYEAVLKIKDLNKTHRKELKHFKMLATARVFQKGLYQSDGALLFAETICGNYYLVHQWGKKLEKTRRFLMFPMRNFECLCWCILTFTLLITLITPPEWIASGDKHLRHVYFSLYRAAWFFHVLILISSMVVFRFFAHRVRFSMAFWDTALKPGGNY